MSCAHGGKRPDGICPACLLELGMRVPFPDGYEPCGELGRGGMGVIYKAKQGECTVALKMIRTSNLPGPNELERFRAEISAVSKLDHPNIVPVYHVGEVEGLPYYSMKLMEGALSEALDRFRGNPIATARLVAGIARGVQHAHERGILHRDLKPGNVLLDRADTPYVADFGMAKLLQEGSTTQSGILGTPSYMAPEQSEGDTRKVTTATDVYALGAILFEVLTGRPPFEAETITALLAKVCREEPPKPRALDPRVPADLETICLKCLEKVPSRRYRTALEIAEELDRFVAGEPILARPLGAFERLARFARRRPFALAAAAGLALLLSGVAVTAVSVARSQEEDLRRSVLDANVYAARAMAGSVLFQLSRQAAQSRRCIEQASLGGADLSGEACVHRQELSERLQGCVEPGGFDSVALMDTRGRVVARWPVPTTKDYFCTDFEWRDYFRGARRLGEAGRRETYVSRAYLSEADGHFKFAFANPVLGPEGTWNGVLIATVGTSAALGALSLRDPNDPRRLGVLVGLRDNGRSTSREPLPEEYMVLLHQALEHGRAVPLPPGTLQVRRVLGSDSFDAPPAEVAVPLEDHRDPLSGAGVRWLAGMAPVGSTPFLVLVQTRYDAVLDVNRTLWNRLSWGGVVLACAMSLVGAAFWGLRRLARRR